MTGSSDAVFDSLWIARRMQSASAAVTLPECHTLAYLACLLAAYDNRETTWWGYTFVSTKVGAPYSLAIAEATELLFSSGLVIEENQRLAVTIGGEAEATLLASFRSYQDRVRYLAAACDCCLAMPLPLVASAVANEPQLRRALTLSQTRQLLDRSGFDMLQPHFQGLRDSLNSYGGTTVHDLFTSAIVWLTYLSQEQLPESLVDV